MAFYIVLNEWFLLNYLGYSLRQVFIEISMVKKTYKLKKSKRYPIIVGSLYLKAAFLCRDTGKIPSLTLFPLFYPSSLRTAHKLWQPSLQSALYLFLAALGFHSS